MNIKGLITRCFIILLSLILIFKVEFIIPYAMILTAIIIGEIIYNIKYKK